VVSYYTTCKTKAIASDRTLVAKVAKVVGMGCIYISNKDKRINWKGKLWKVGILARGCWEE
jgi:hypothetical protein